MLWEGQPLIARVGELLDLPPPSPHMPGECGWGLSHQLEGPRIKLPQLSNKLDVAREVKQGVAYR